MSIRDYSIQDYLKNINRSLSVLDCVSIFVVFAILVVGVVVIKHKNSLSTKEIVYHEVLAPVADKQNKRTLPFASKNGTTYTFSWCSSSSRILEKNRIYFQSEEEAKKSGRRLSKLCDK